MLIFSKEFNLDNEIIYLNHAAVSPWPRRTCERIKEFATENMHQGATNYKKWLEVERQLKFSLKNLINAPFVNDIALLKNTSEAISVVAEGLNWRSGDNIVSTNEEFPSNRIPWQAQIEKGVSYREVDISNNDNMEEQIIEACDNKTKIITISSVQYGSGRCLDLQYIGDFCEKNNILFCVDAIQSLAVKPLDVQKIKADFIMADAHKWMLGPEGIAVFYCAEKVREQLKLHQYGWHMVEEEGNYDNKNWSPASSARRFECGSPNMLGIYALSASLSLIEDVGAEEISRFVLKKTKYLIDYIKNNNKLLLVTPELDKHRAGIVTFKVKNRDNMKIYHNLMENMVVCAHRMGCIRFSPHFYTEDKKITESVNILDSII